MKMPNKHEWSEIILVAVFAGGFSSGIALLQRIGFDKDATFAFLGALVGAAATVFLSIGQQERQAKRAKERERQEISLFFSSTSAQIDRYFGSPFKLDDKGNISLVGCLLAIPSIENLRDYAIQAARHAVHLGFHSRAHLEFVVAQCERTLAALRQILAEDDVVGGRPDFESGRAAIVNLHNAMTLASLP